MRKDIITEDEQGRVEMRGLVDSDDIDKFNAGLRSFLGNGVTKGGTFRYVANIDGDEYNAFLLNMDKDALDFEASERKDKQAFGRLLKRFPAWRISDGGV
jgi:hypothetical protein